VRGSISKFFGLRLSRGTATVFSHRLWQGGAGLVTLACIAHFLTPVEQGFYYTFASLTAVHVLLDMGLSVVLIQVAAHEFCGLAWGARGEVVGEGAERFLCLMRKAFFWYAMAALVFLLAYPGGLLFLNVPNLNLGYDWRLPWLALVLAAAASLLFLPFLAVIEGTGAITEVYTVRLFQAVASSCAIWLTLSGGGGLYAVVMMPAASALVAGGWLFSRHRGFLRQIFILVCRDFRWQREVWPMQWRIGVSWISGYLLMQIHTPLLFRVKGAVVAGQMGLTLTVANMLGLLAMAGVTSVTPDLAKAAAARNWAEMDTCFRKVFIVSSLAYLLGAIAFLAIRAALSWTAYGERFLSIPLCVALLSAIFAAHLMGLLSVYLRAHRREPFMLVSIISAVITVSGALLTVSRWGAAGIVSVMLAVNFLFGVPVTYWLWIRLRRQWHYERGER